MTFPFRRGSSRRHRRSAAGGANFALALLRHERCVSCTIVVAIESVAEVVNTATQRRCHGPISKQTRGTIWLRAALATFSRAELTRSPTLIV